MKRFVDNYRMDLKRPILPVDLGYDRCGDKHWYRSLPLTISGGQIIITDYERRRNKGGIDIQTPFLPF